MPFSIDLRQHTLAIHRPFEVLAFDHMKDGTVLPGGGRVPLVLLQVDLGAAAAAVQLFQAARVVEVQVADEDHVHVGRREAEPRQVLELRRSTIGYVSQFLRIIPRVSALDIVAEPLLEDAVTDPDVIEGAREQARLFEDPTGECRSGR